MSYFKVETIHAKIDGFFFFCVKAETEQEAMDVTTSFFPLVSNPSDMKAISAEEIPVYPYAKDALDVRVFTAYPAELFSQYIEYQPTGLPKPFSTREIYHPFYWVWSKTKIVYESVPCSCGGTALPGINRNKWYIICLNESCRKCTTGFQTKREAIEKWSKDELHP